MAPDQKKPNENTSDQATDGCVTRRDLAKKAVYVVPAVLAVIAATERPVFAGSGLTQ
jgi:hypothetical protein